MDHVYFIFKKHAADVSRFRFCVKTGLCVLTVNSPGRVQFIVLSPCDQLRVNPYMFQHRLRDKHRQSFNHLQHFPLSQKTAERPPGGPVVKGPTMTCGVHGSSPIEALFMAVRDSFLLSIFRLLQKFLQRHLIFSSLIFWRLSWSSFRSSKVLYFKTKLKNCKSTTIPRVHFTNRQPITELYIICELKLNIKLHSSAAQFA